MKKLIFILFTIILLTGCSANKIDTSSDKKLKASVEKIKNSLSNEDKKKFEQAIMLLIFQDYDSINGKTADEIIALAKLIESKTIDALVNFEKEMIDDAKEELSIYLDQRKKIEKQIKVIAQNKVKLNKLVKRTTYELNQYSNIDFLSFNVTNLSNKTITSIQYRLSAHIKGRKVPLDDKKSIIESFKAGLEPQETKEASFWLYNFRFTSEDDQSKIVLTLELSDIKDSDNESIYDTNDRDLKYDLEQIKHDIKSASDEVQRLIKSK